MAVAKNVIWILLLSIRIIWFHYAAKLGIGLIVLTAAPGFMGGIQFTLIMWKKNWKM